MRAAPLRLMVNEVSSKNCNRDTSKSILLLWCWRRLLSPFGLQGNQPWIFLKRTDAEALILWPPDAKSQLIKKRPWCWKRLKAGEGDNREIKPINPKGDQPWIFIGRTDAEAPTVWPPDAKSQLIRKTQMLRKIEGKRRGQQRLRWLDSITNTMDMNLSKLQVIVRDREGWHAALHGATKSWTWLCDWKTTIPDPFYLKTNLSLGTRVRMISAFHLGQSLNTATNKAH